MWDTDEAVERIDAYLDQLKGTLAPPSDWPTVLERMERWHTRVRTWLNETFGGSEAARFSSKCVLPETFAPGGQAMEVYKNLDRYLSTLREDIVTDPDHWQDVMLGVDDGDDDGLRGGNRIALGHGRSSEWRKVEAYLADDLGLEVDAFESQSRGGHHIIEVLESIISAAGFGVVVMTAEDATPEGTQRARQNVVHETGLFQGRVGFHRVALLVEQGVEEFSNIHGLQQIRFPRGQVEASFRELRAMLQREGFV